MVHPSSRSFLASRLPSAALALVLAFLNVTVASAQDTVPTLRIAVVDLERVVMQSASGKALQGRLEEFQRQISVQAEQMQSEGRDLRQRIADGVNTLSEEKLAELQKQYEDKTIEIRRFRDDKQREGQKMQAEGLREIESQLEPIFEQVRDELGLDLILNNVPGVVVMANEKADITEEVVARLNSSAGSAG